MTDQDARTLSRLLVLYRVQPILERIGQAVRSYASQDRKTWGNEEWRMRAVMKGYNHPSSTLKGIRRRRKV